MQSPFLERNSQKPFSSLKPNTKQTLESSLENKENFETNNDNKLPGGAEIQGNKAILPENPQKYSEKLSSIKSNLENLEASLTQEIQEIIARIEDFENTSLLQNENKIDFAICAAESEFTENADNDENNYLHKPSAAEKPSLEAYIGNESSEENVDLANSASANKNKVAELIETPKVTENVESCFNYFANDNLSKKHKLAYGESLKQLFRSLFIKLEKLFEIHSEAQFANFTETNFSENAQNWNFNFVHNSENKNNNSKINYYQNNNNNNNNCLENPKNETTSETKGLNLISANDDLLTKLIKICTEKSLFCDLMNFYLKTENEAKAIDLFQLKRIVNFNDYEEAIFFLSEDLTRNLTKIELLFKILHHAAQSFVFGLYPVFSVCLHKLVKSGFIQEAFVLKNYMLHFKLEISSMAINSLLEALGKSGRLEDAVQFLKEVENTNFIHLLQSALAHSDSDSNEIDNFDSCSKMNNDCNYINKSTFTKLSFYAGLNLISYGILIKHLCKSNLIETALVHYEHLKSNKLIKDEVIFNLLIDGCSKASNLSQITIIYQDMLSLQIKPSIVTFNTIIDSFVRAKDLASAWKIFEDIGRFGCAADNFTFSTLFRGIRNSNHKDYLEKAFLIIDELNRKNSSIDVILVNVLIDSCICLKDEKNLVKIFHNAVNCLYKSLSPDIITFNTFIKGCAQLNLFDQATDAFKILLSKQDSIVPNDVSFNTMIDVYVRSANLNLVWDLLDLMKKYGIKPDNFTYSTIIKGINKKSNFNSCMNNTSSNLGYNKSLPCDNDEAELQMAFKLFENVKTYSKPDEILYNCIMDACLRFEKIDKMMEYHEEMIREKVKPSSITCGILIKAYGMSGMVEKALGVYENMKRENVEISSITYGCLINACIKNNILQKSFELYQELDENNIEMNTVLYTTMIKAYSKKNNLLKVIEIFEKMKKDKINMPNNVTYNSVIDCCIKCNNMREAESKFAEMKFNKIKPDIITFSTLIKGCLKTSLLEKAINYLHTMIDLGIKPDDVLLNSLLDGCEKMDKFTQARDIFLFVRKFGVEPSMMSFSIMMKIYGKLKDYNNSYILIQEVKAKPKNCSLIIFTCFIKTCLQTKNLNEALSTYESLKGLGIQADQITFHTILKGLVINKTFEFIPKIINDSLQNPITFCSIAIYSEALNALNKNLSKANLTKSDLFEIRRNLAFNNIFIEISNNETSYNNKSDAFHSQANNFNNPQTGNYNENQSFNGNSFSNNYNRNYSNKKGKNGRNGFINKQENFNSFKNQKEPEETYVDNFDFLINGYKNNQKNFDYNFNSSTNDKSQEQQYSITYNTSTRKANNYNQAPQFNFKKQIYYSKNHNSNHKNANYENNKSLHEQMNNSNTTNVINNSNMLESTNNYNNNYNDFSNENDDSAFFDKPSFDVSAIDRPSDIQKAFEEKLNIQTSNTAKQSASEAQPDKLKERSSFYKNFANLNDVSIASDNFKNEQKNQILKNFDKICNQKKANEGFDKTFIPKNYVLSKAADKENISNEYYNTNKKNSSQEKNANNNINYAHKNKEGLKKHSNNFANGNVNYSNLPNPKNQIFRKGFNMPPDANTDKIANISSVKNSQSENDENSNLNYNADAYTRKPKKFADNFIKAGNNYAVNSSQIQQAAGKPVKKLTRF